VCLGLTCKSMARLILRVTKLSPAEWTPFIDNRYGQLCSYELLPRLAHGWIPKDRFRFCSWCCKIATRSPQYWEARCTLPDKPIRWSSHLTIPKYQWMVMSKKAKYKHLILRWRDAASDDGSGAKCVHCAVPPKPNLWYEMIHCPQCTANTLALTPPGRRRPMYIMRRIKTTCLGVFEAVRYYIMDTVELVRSATSSFLRLAMRHLQLSISKGRHILPRWRSH
jgi:hypothetical protein